VIVGGTVGAALGAGSVKQSIYTSVRDSLLDVGKTKEEAELAANRAQQYIGENTDQITFGALVGALANATGIEGAPVARLASRVAPRLAAEVAERAASRGVASITTGKQSVHRLANLDRRARKAVCQR
jgi:hypothetical protein